MIIETVRHRFGGRGLVVRVSEGSTTLDVDIDSKELRAFAYMLVDVADDALSLIGSDAELLQSRLRECLEDLHPHNSWPSPRDEQQ